MGYRYLKDVTTLTLDRDKCTGCRMCSTVCPQAVWQLQNKRAHIADPDACMEDLTATLKSLGIEPIGTKEHNNLYTEYCEYKNANTEITIDRNNYSDNLN